MSITNTNYFREEALKFQENGYYCKYPNDSPQAKNYWNEQAKRSIYGYKRNDGIWVTGYHYFYLNFCPIELATTTEDLSLGTNVHGEREYDFPSFWDGDYDFYHYVQRGEDVGLFGDVDKVRGSGFSCKGASMANRNYFLIPRSKSYLVVYDKQFLLGDGIMTKVTSQMDFIDEHTAFSKRRLIDKDLHKKSGYTIKTNNGVWVEKGFKSEILGVSISDEPDKMRGKRGKLIIYDEAGAFPKLYRIWGTSIASMRQGRVVYGYMLAMGTGGSTYNYSMSLEDMFYNPEAYEILPVENIWDKNVAKGSKCGFFFPASQNREGHYDKDGNSNLETAKEEILKEREYKLKVGATSDVVTRHIAEYPLVPRESFLKTIGTIFPVNELNEHLVTLEMKPREYQDKQYIGKLIDTVDGIKWTLDNSCTPISDFPLRDKERKEGSPVIWEHPIKSEITQKVRDDIYIGGCLTPGEKVITDKGLKNVEEVTYEDRLINKDGKSVHINEIMLLDKIEESTYKIKPYNTVFATNLTSEHPVYVSNSLLGEYSFVKAEEVKSGMWTKYPNIYKEEKRVDNNIWEKYRTRRLSFIENPLNNEEFWWFVGMWLGDGFCSKTGKNLTIYMSFGDRASDYITRYKNLVSTLFNRKAILKSANKSNALKFECTQLFNFLNENFGKGAEGKYISEWVKYLPVNLRLQLILGYLDSDGSVYFDNGCLKGSFVSINKKLLSDVQDILFSVGVISAFTLHSKETSYCINGKTGISKESYKLRLNLRDLKTLGELYSWNYNSRKLDLILSTEIKQKAQIDNNCIISEDLKYIYLKISSIEKNKYTGVVYNFNCETHTFLCPYLTTHNCDPYDDDKADSSPSLGSIFIMNVLTGRIVAEYTGRPESAEYFYEICFKLTRYYSASINYERNKKGLYTYAKNNKLLQFLCAEPKNLRDLNLSKANNTGNNYYGTNANGEINSFARRLINEWLISPAYNEDPNESTVKNLHTIRSKPLLKELIFWNDQDNFDRVSSLGMLMILRENLKPRIDGIRNNKALVNNEDSFWSKHYQKRNTGKAFGVVLNSQGELVKD